MAESTIVFETMFSAGLSCLVGVVTVVGIIFLVLRFGNDDDLKWN